MANASQAGFWPEGNQGTTATQTKRVRIASANGTAIFLGDCLKRTAAGVWGLATAGAGIAGVSQGASYYSAADLVRKEGTYLPASTTYSSTAFDTYGETDESFIYTVADPVNVRYRCQNPAVPALADLSGNANLSVAAGSTTTGISGHVLGTIDTTQGDDFAIMDFVHSPLNDLTLANAKYIVQINKLIVAPGSSGATGV